MTNTVKTLTEARARIQALEAELAGKSKPGQKPLDNPYKNPGKPAPSKPATPKGLKPTRPFGTNAAIDAVNSVLSGRASIEEVRAAIKSATSIQDKLALISEVQTNIRAEIEKAGNDMTAATPLYRKLQDAQTAEGYLRLAESIALGPRATRAKNLLEKYDL
jgi:hypothetical protein